MAEHLQQETSRSVSMISTLPMPGYKPGPSGEKTCDVKEEAVESMIQAQDPQGHVSREVLERAAASGAFTEKKPNGSIHTHAPHSIAKRKLILNGQEGYGRKLKRLRLLIKNTMFMNAAICDEVLRTEEKLAKAKEERRFLLRKLLQHQSVGESVLAAIKSEPQNKHGKGSQNGQTGEANAKTSKASKKKNAVSAASSSSSGPHPLTSLATSTNASATTASPLLATGTPQLPGLGSSGVADSKKKQVSSAKDISGAAPAKPKKGKGVNKKIIPPLMLDSLGRPVFPMVLGDVTLHSIGEIMLDRPNFHSVESIYPAGYCITRLYGSLHKLDSSCLWTCKISEDDEGPLFEIAAEDSSDILFRAASPQECHAQMVRAFNKTRGIPLETTSEAAGLDFFALSHPVIQNLIQSCPGARKCPRYKWVKFEINRQETNENVSVGVSDPSVGLEAYKAHLIAMGFKPSARSTEQAANLRSLLSKKHRL